MKTIECIEFYCVLENGFVGYNKVVVSQDIAAEAVEYFKDILERVGLDTQLVTIMVEVKAEQFSRSSVVGQYVVSNGSFYAVVPDFSRLVRQFCHHSV